MTSAIFDSHKYAKRLIDAGVPPQAADVQAEAMLKVMTQVAASSATVNTQDSKIDRMDSKIDRLDSKIDRSVAELKAIIEQAKAELTRWIIGFGVTILGVISALKLLH